MDSWYSFDDSVLNKRQKKYISTIESSFKVKNEKGEFVPYKLYPYQKHFHSESVIARGLNKVRDRLMLKCRGVGYSTMVAIDVICTAQFFDNTTFPILSFRFDAAKELISNIKKIISYSRYSKSMKSSPLETEIKFTNGSVIRAYPGGNEESLRSIRTVSVLVDEFAFFRNDEGSFAALQDTIINRGQLNIGSTPAGKNNKFWKLIENPVEYNFEYFYFPVFEPSKFNPKKNILEQPDLVPIADYMSLEKLESKKTRDLEIFMQEQMGIALDDTTAFIPMSHVLSCIEDKLINEIDGIEPITSSFPIYAGVDVATKKDYAVVTVMEKTPFGWIMRGLKIFPEIALPSLQLYCENLLVKNPQILRMNIDMTGIGSQTAQYLRRTFGSRVVGVHFASNDESKQPVREKMAITLKTLISDMKIKLINDPILINHLASINRDLKSTSKEGHSDCFWATALAVTDGFEDKSALKNIGSVGGNFFGVARRL